MGKCRGWETGALTESFLEKVTGKLRPEEGTGAGQAKA